MRRTAVPDLSSMNADLIPAAGLPAVAVSAVERTEATLAALDSIQQAIAREPGFQAIVDIVGARLLELLGTRNLKIFWRDPGAPSVDIVYDVEDGQRLTGTSVPTQDEGGRIARKLAEGKPLVL